MSIDGAEFESLSPLGQRDVQWTLVVIAVTALVVALISVLMHPEPESGSDQDGRNKIAGGMGRIPTVKIDINAAPAHELSLLPGVGPVLADRMVDDRNRNGDFDSVADLRRVFGIGPRKIEEISH